MKYKDWFEQQDEAFQNEINPHRATNNKFVDYRLHAIDLNKLIEYDNQYCCYKIEESDDAH